MQMFILLILLSFPGGCSTSETAPETGASIRQLKVNSDDEGLKLIQNKKNFYSELILQKPEGQLSPSFAEEECFQANEVGEIENIRGGKALSLRLVLRNGAGFCPFDPGAVSHTIIYYHCQGQKYVTEFICPDKKCPTKKGKDFCL